MSLKRNHRPVSLPFRSKSVTTFMMVVVLLVFWKKIMLDILLGAANSSFLQRSAESLSPIANQTLGFQMIFAISLRERQDRIVPLLQAGNATNITIQIIDGIKDADVTDEQKPKGWGSLQEPHKGEIGTLRAHVTTWEKIVRENISTALILEDDADWDMRIHDILPNVAEGVKEIADFPFLKHPRVFPSDKPYGDNWDMLWIGHCGMVSEGNSRFYTFNDSTAPSEDHEYSFTERPTFHQQPNGTRSVFEVGVSVCAWGYAITRRGAIKMIKFLEEAERPIDVKMWQLCGSKDTLTCLGVYPQVISGAPSKSSIEHIAGEIPPPMKIDTSKGGHLPGPALQYSARRNAHIVAKGVGPGSWIKEW